MKTKFLNFIRYVDNDESHFKTCRDMPWQCFTCQMIKLGNGVHSGRYSQPMMSHKQDKDPYSIQEGIALASFKSIIGRNHPEFSTMRQQDAVEFFDYFIKVVEQKEKISEQDPVEEFRFVLHQRIQCQSCGGVRRSSFTTSSLSIPFPMDMVDISSLESISPGKSEPSPSIHSAISLKDCFNEFMRDEEVYFRCPSCKEQTKAKK
jgi:ubiquitin carboxyl-terminal hydrolase 5/13